MIKVARALILACHPLPTLAVTGISAGLAALAGLNASTSSLMVLAVFTGQLSIGWSNDRIDAARDREVRRTDKPIAAGEVPAEIVTAAIAVALTASVVLSLLLGYRAGLVSVFTVGCGWSYNLWLKATVLSWLPYALAFGLLPAVATLALSSRRWPVWWALTAGALLGVAAHIANVLPDLQADEATGVRGLPHRLGLRASVVVAPLLLVAASGVIVFAGATRLGGWRWPAFSACVVVAATAASTGLARPSSRYFFVGTILIAAADVALFGLSGGRLS